jgi:hypothetical protein
MTLISVSKSPRISTLVIWVVPATYRGGPDASTHLAFNLQFQVLDVVFRNGMDSMWERGDSCAQFAESTE